MYLNWKEEEALSVVGLPVAEEGGTRTSSPIGPGLNTVVTSHKSWQYLSPKRVLNLPTSPPTTILALPLPFHFWGMTVAL